MTPIQFLGRSRITRACTLLRDSPISIADLAFDLGYSDRGESWPRIENVRMCALKTPLSFLLFR